MSDMRILLVEDDPVYAGAVRRMLGEAGLADGLHEAGTLRGGLAAAEEGADAALLDLALPDSRGTETVKDFCGAFPTLPVVVLTGTDDEETGAEALKFGAQDYLVKGQFDDRLLKRAIRYSIERQALLNEKGQLITGLQDALKRVRLLTGLLPTCCECRKIKNPDGKWVQMETYISGHSEAVFTHGYCDSCFERKVKEMK